METCSFPAASVLRAACAGTQRLQMDSCVARAAPEKMALLGHTRVILRAKETWLMLYFARTLVAAMVEHVCVGAPRRGELLLRCRRCLPGHCWKKSNRQNHLILNEIWCVQLHCGCFALRLCGQSSPLPSLPLKNCRQRQQAKRQLTSHSRVQAAALS